MPGPDRTVSGEPAVLTVPEPVLLPEQALSLVYVLVPQYSASAPLKRIWMSLPSRRCSKCRCGPVEPPVVPT
ncbi:hypothetical protein [Phytohabitans rumicis]|uniref:hypothetical protein n=1 Tax=Phytohabitans rumicis TaxID=1076125 RepID=UPI001FEC7A23|nr:hypothetical protein [Phytohabitans rumicis]